MNNSNENKDNNNIRSNFNYDLAFSRNLGLVQPDEQKILKNTRVAIAGLGGVGGAHANTLARLGIGKFKIADFDIFEIQNFNRQMGATISNLHKPKSEVIRKIITDINPTAEVEEFIEGVQLSNINNFLNDVDIVIDGLDFFAVSTRELLYKEAFKKNIPVVGTGPIGFSVILLTFMPGKMTWNDYFCMDLAKSETEKYLLFALGNAPSGLHVSYIDSKYMNLDLKQGPSAITAVQMCSGVLGTEVLKIVLKRGTVLSVPYYHQFDPYKNKYIVKKLRWGNKGIFQRIKFYLLKKFYLSNKIS